MKCLNISMRSISSEKGDRAILLSARLMVLMAAFGRPFLSLLSDTAFLSLDSFDLSLDS